MLIFNMKYMEDRIMITIITKSRFVAGPQIINPLVILGQM